MSFTDALNKILIVDGAYGTLFQSRQLSESDYKNHPRLHNHPQPLKGNHDVLNLTAPEVVKSVHTEYLRAGAQILKTNTFSASRISQADYGLASLAADITRAGAVVARAACDEFFASTGIRAFVAGDLGPTNKTLTISPDVSRPGFRSISFDELEAAYHEQISALVSGGVDLILIETIFDTLNAKAAIAAYQKFFEGKTPLPLWISGTITDKSGRTLSGQTLEAFYTSVAHARPTLMGLNCALGARELLPHIRELSALASCGIACHPNAGLPNALGGYDNSPASMAATMAQMAHEGLLNVAGGCCGTTPAHIAAIAEALRNIAPRSTPRVAPALSLSGLEPLRLPRDGAPFVFIGERTNVSGSPKFAKLIRAGDLSGALSIAAEQVRAGATVLDVCFDDGLLDGARLMTDFLNLVASEPAIARVPLMIDSSSLPTIEAGLKTTQGKCIVNSISLKEGAEKFLAAARLVRRYGAAVIVMAFDEAGQATDVARRVEICSRAYQLLTAEGIPADDIIFDPNILTIGTGIAAHAPYASDFLAALPLIKKACQGARLSGGVSNLSFAFRGLNIVREALHSIFLSHAIAAGLDMAIVNAGMIRPVESIPADLTKLCEDLIFNRSSTATDELLAYGRAHLGEVPTQSDSTDSAWRHTSVAERMAYALINGVGDFVAADAAEALTVYEGKALSIIEGPLMDGMRRVGDLFGAGKMFLPQVVKSARVMKEFVTLFEPHLTKAGQAASKQGKILLATVKGDVHDIGKNIVGLVLACNNYEVIDLGVMVGWPKILEAIRTHKPDLVGFSGLITPSLGEMVANAQAMTAEGLTIPLLIGGATTSKLHTALKIAPHYAHGVVQVPDASRVVEVAQKILSPTHKARYLAEVAASYESLRISHAAHAEPLEPLEFARQRTPEIIQKARPAPFTGVRKFEFSPSVLVRTIDWSPFFWAWGLKGVYPKILSNPEAAKLLADAEKLLEKISADSSIVIHAAMGFWPARRVGDDVEIKLMGNKRAVFHFLRQQRSTSGTYGCLADFISSHISFTDSLGGFVVSVDNAIEKLAARYTAAGDDYSAIIVKALGDRLAESAAETLHAQARELWGQRADQTLDELIDEKYEGIRPASGYPSCPDHTEKKLLWELLKATENTHAVLTENFAMSPASTVSGLYFHHPQARYFAVGGIGEDQLTDYAKRKNWSLDEAKKWLGNNL